MPSCISPSLNNSYSLFHIHPRVLNRLHRQFIPQPFSYPPAAFIRLQSQPAEVVSCSRPICTNPLLIFSNDPNATLIKPLLFIHYVLRPGNAFSFCSCCSGWLAQQATRRSPKTLCPYAALWRIQDTRFASKPLRRDPNQA